MTLRDGVYASELGIVRIIREIARREFAKFWRALARPVTFFDLCSPSISWSRKSANSLGKSAPGRTRTCDPRLRRPVLYPTELLAHKCRL